MNRLQRFLARIAGLPVPSAVDTINAETIEQLRRLGPAGVVRVTDPHGIDIEGVRRAIEAALPAGVGLGNVVQLHPGMKPPADPDGDEMTWAMWLRCMGEIALEGWSPCRLGNRTGTDSMKFVFGVARGDYGIWQQPFPVCDDVAEISLEPMILTSLTFIPHGLGVGVFATRECAAKAAELAGPILHGMAADNWNAWMERKDRLHETWRFNGIREDEHRHTHSGDSPAIMPIWDQTAANMLEGKPEKVS